MERRSRMQRMSVVRGVVGLGAGSFVAVVILSLISSLAVAQEARLPAETERQADSGGVSECPPACAGADLREADLSGADFGGADLARAKLSGVILAGANLMNANLMSAGARIADFTNAILVNANLTDAIFELTDLTGANLSGANLSGANFGEAILTDATLPGATLIRTTLGYANLTAANLMNADLTGAYAVYADLGGANLRGANLMNADLGSANLRAANLMNANLTSASAHSANLGGADLRGANLTNANISWAQLAGARLTGADFTGASFNSSTFGAMDLSGADLSGLNLGFADLTGANLSNADLTGSDLGGADLTGANLRGANLKDAHLGLATFTSADLSAANLSYAYLNGNVTLGHAKLAGTDLSHADLRDASLAGADLGSVNLTGTDLAGADLTGADLPPPPDPDVAGWWEFCQNLTPPCIVGADEQAAGERREGQASAAPSLLSAAATRGVTVLNSLLLLIDSSGSMDSEIGDGNPEIKMHAAKDAAIAAVDRALANKATEVAVLAFEGECQNPVSRQLGFTTDIDRLTAFINGLQPGGGTPMAEAVLFANRFMQANRSPAAQSQMIVLLADGDNDCGDVAQAMAELHATGTVFRHETVGFGIAPTSDAARDLRHVATTSGGQYHHATSATQLADVFMEFVDTFTVIDMLGMFGGSAPASTPGGQTSPTGTSPAVAQRPQSDARQDSDSGGVTGMLGMFTTDDTDDGAAGALAIDAEQGTAWGWAAGYATVAEAERRALQECGEGCRIVMRFEDECAAYAADQKQGSTIRGWSFGFASGGQAESAALEACRKRGGLECIVRVWACGG